MKERFRGCSLQQAARLPIFVAPPRPGSDPRPSGVLCTVQYVQGANRRRVESRVEKEAPKLVKDSINYTTYLYSTTALGANTATAAVNWEIWSSALTVSWPPLTEALVWDLVRKYH